MNCFPFFIIRPTNNFQPLSFIYYQNLSSKKLITLGVRTLFRNRALSIIATKQFKGARSSDTSDHMAIPKDAKRKRLRLLLFLTTTSVKMLILIARCLKMLSSMLWKPLTETNVENHEDHVSNVENNSVGMTSDFLIGSDNLGAVCLTINSTKAWTPLIKNHH